MVKMASMAAIGWLKKGYDEDCGANNEGLMMGFAKMVRQVVRVSMGEMEEWSSMQWGGGG